MQKKIETFFENLHVGNRSTPLSRIERSSVVCEHSGCLVIRLYRDTGLMGLHGDMYGIYREI